VFEMSDNVSQQSFGQISLSTWHYLAKLLVSAGSARVSKGVLPNH